MRNRDDGEVQDGHDGHDGRTGRHRRAGSSSPDEADERVLARVRALLAKAEATEFEEEAHAFTAKAQELMARYALTEAMLEADGAPSRVRRRRIVLDPPYADAKAFLLGRVARANRCRTVWTRHPLEAHLFGYSADVQAVELLYTSLLIQVAQAMRSQGPVVDRGGTSRTRSFRRSFLIGFAARIGERLAEADRSTVEVMEAEFGASLLPVLADRSVMLDREVDEAFPHTVAHDFVPSNAGGYLAGKAAGDRASVHARAGMTRPGSVGALGQ